MLNTKTETQFLFILFQFPTTEGEWIHVGNEFERNGISLIVWAPLTESM